MTLTGAFSIMEHTRTFFIVPAQTPARPTALEVIADILLFTWRHYLPLNELKMSVTNHTRQRDRMISSAGDTGSVI
jgi:hypothetical protein